MDDEINPTSGMNSQTNPIDSNDPLYFHPRDGASTVRTGQPLTGPQNYREWKREMGISLALKRKLELVIGKVKKPTNDPVRASAWDACNNLVISWLLGSMDSLTRKSVMYYTNCKTIWDDLEDYYTELKALWDELEALTEYPPMTSFPPELMALDKFLDKQNEEMRLFQFLNGLDPEYSTLRSNMLMMTQLPTVEAAFAYVQQEEDLAKQGQMTPMETEASALFSKGEYRFACPICRMDNHSEEQCWKKIGYPAGHPKNNRKLLGQKPEFKFQGNYKPQKNQGFKNKSNYSPSHSGTKGAQYKGKKTAEHVSSYYEEKDLTSSIQRATRPLESLLGSVLGNSNMGADTDEEIDQAFTGMITCNLVNMSENMWVVDSGASDHMSFSKKRYEANQTSQKQTENYLAK
ncbi:hypothetical protein RND81_03G087600 [Saponaria officinalis]|uniref:Retrotransposon Copia-like N-terminal domain-containing protein n=1 Tax=Saponaria officinalis TaxID=3572 RepID=A0AAW1M5D1_SAPOF